jgi:predicted nucleotidyltransferase
MDDLLSRCSFPLLNPPYAQALHEAVELILARFTPVGIIAAGSILRGNPDRTSDLDIYVIHTATYRQRTQRFFNGVPAEIFVNPPAQIERYFAEEHSSGKPITAHMLSNGFLVLSTDQVVEKLLNQARDWLSKTPSCSETQLTWTRYLAGNLYEDALDLSDRDPATSQMFLSRAIAAMLEYFFQSHNLFLPPGKELLVCVTEHDARLGQSARDFFTGGDLAERLHLAEQIADATIGVHGFFEWESSPEEVPTS